jgi:A118 family predicted phage portal protein
MDTSDEMVNKISLWKNMFENKSPWLVEENSAARSTGLPSAVASELARLTTIECKISVTGSERADYISQTLEPLRDKLRSRLEYGLAEGGLIFKPYVSAGNIYIDCARQDSFYPIAFDDSHSLSAVAFVQTLTRGNMIYTKLEYHHMEADGCHIENKAFSKNTLAKSAEILGQQCKLSDIPEWADVQPEAILKDANKLPLGYFRMPAANTSDADSQLGTSCYSRAVPIIRQADEQWGRILWEYEGSELAVHADESMFKRIDGTVEIPKGYERLYRNIPGLDDDKKMDTFSPAIRDASLFNGMNEILRRIEFTCGLAYGTLSNVQDVPQTATQINASKQRSYSTVKDIQKSLQNALDDLIQAIDYWVTAADEINIAPGTYQTAYDWDDSIVNEPSQEKQMFWQYVVAGKFPFWAYLVKFEGYTEKDAKAIASEAQQAQADPFADGNGGIQK